MTGLGEAAGAGGPAGAALDAGLVGGWAMTLAAALACAVWADRATRPAPLTTRSAVALAVWAGALGAVHLLSLASLRGAEPFGSAAWLGWLPVLISMAAVVLGAYWAGSRVVLAGRLFPVVVDSAIMGVGATTIVWGLSGSEREGFDVVVPLFTAILGATVVALVLRARALSPSLVIDGRFRTMLGWVGVSAAAFAVSGLMALRTTAVGHAIAVGVVLGHLASAMAALTISAAPRAAPAPRRAGLVERLAPTIVIGAAVIALLLRVAGSSGRIGTVGAVLGTALFAGLVVSQALASREIQQLAADLEYSRARLAAMAANSADVIMGLDEDGRVLAVNDAAVALLGRTPDVLVGTDLSALAAEDERFRVRAAVLDVVQGLSEASRVELTLAGPAVGTAELRLRGVPGGAVANISDVTESVQLRERLVHLTRFDQMTGLATRAHLEEVIGRWLEEGADVAALYIDLDGFKRVNDRFGHAAGDAVLGEVAHRLSRVAAAEQATAVVARTGGDEFVIVLRDRSTAEAVALGEVVLSALRPTFRVSARQVRLGASIGVSGTDDGSSGPSADARLDPRSGADRPEAGGAAALLHRADVAMYSAKEAGRFQVRIWDPELEARVRRRVDIAIVLRRALATGRLALAYQPIVRLSDGTIVGVEALIRLQPADVVEPDDDLQDDLPALSGLISPSELVEVAEGTGEIDELGRWVLTEATHQASLWRRMNHAARVTVNMSVRQLSDPRFEETVLEALAASRLPADRLIIEITEGQLIGEDDVANETLTRLRAHGIQLAIDDFGSGYSSLSYLRRMPVTAVKIDRTLLSGVGSDDRATTVVRAVIGAARGLGLRVICEGIESLAMARYLRDMGAYAGQGFALYEALTPERLREVLDGPPVDLAGSGRTPPVGISHAETGLASD